MVGNETEPVPAALEMLAELVNGAKTKSVAVLAEPVKLGKAVALLARVKVAIVAKLVVLLRPVGPATLVPLLELSVIAMLMVAVLLPMPWVLVMFPAPIEAVADELEE